MYLNVAPFTGAWIEIAAYRRSRFLPEVAPFTGAWIEITIYRMSDEVLSYVAPFTGAWIEIKNGRVYFSIKPSRALHGRVD